MLKHAGIRFYGIMSLLIVLTFVLAACPAAAPSAETTAPEESPSVAEPTEAASTEAEAVATEEPEADGEVVDAEATEAPAEEAPATETESAAGSIAFQIVPESSEARFSIFEVLLGQDKTVIGVTSLVEGSITVDPADPSSATLSPIRINARDLTTDSDRRNGAIRRFILESNRDEYEYIVFTPTSIAGMPESVAVGDTFDFTVIGDLTIRDITNQVTFDVTVTANSESELVGLATTTVLRADYNLRIPNVPSVANVGEEVPLELDFTAVAN